MDDVNPYQPPQELTSEPSGVAHRLTLMGFLPFVGGVGLCMAAILIADINGKHGFDLILLLIALIATCSGTALVSLISYGWLRFRVGKYGAWQQRPVILFISGLMYFPVASLCGGALILSLAQVCPDSIVEVLAPVVLIGSFFAYLELLRFQSQRGVLPHTGP
jgi:hypothetical protein